MAKSKPIIFIPKKQKGSRLRELKWEREGECMVVTSHKVSRGYIRLERNGARFLLHRLVCERRHGPLGDKLACHTCDNRRCINPGHLVPGTCAENLHQMKDRKRSTFGERNGMCKITAELALQIFNAKGKYYIIGLKYGVGATHVSQIKNKTCWKHLHE